MAGTLAGLNGKKPKAGGLSTIMSDEDKEMEFQKAFIAKKRRLMKRREFGLRNNKRSGYNSNFQGQNVYAQMIKYTFIQIRDLNAKEEESTNLKLENRRNERRADYS